MTYTKEPIERRKHRRFRVQNGSFAVLSPSDTKVGRLMDISISGLAFHYVGVKERMIESTQLSIFSGDCSFYLYRVPCKTICDLRPYPSSGPISVRRCSVQFGELTENQMSRLKRFIRDYTTGEMTSYAKSAPDCQRTDGKPSIELPLF